MHADTATQPHHETKTPPVAPTRKRAILLVEDDLDMVHFLKSLLATLDNCQVIHATDGRTANEFLRVGEVDLVLTDILMPEMDGMEVIRHVRETRGELPVIAMTGGGRRLPGLDLVRYAELLGADKAVSKPINPQALLMLLNDLLPTLQ